MESLEARPGKSDKVRVKVLNNMIVAQNINKVYKQGFRSVHAVKEADIRVDEGERVYVHGPSGAGKSTLLHVLGALDKPTAGKVSFREKSIYALSDRKRSSLRNRNFGFIFQFYHLLSELNVLENVMLPAMIKGGASSGKIKSRAKGLLDMVGMSDRLKHRTHQISGGEAQRTAIARALVNSPDVIFCDEPTGNLDSKMSEEIYDLLYKISEASGMSVVVVSHQEVEKDFFHTEYYMKDGVLEKVTDKGTKEVEDLMTI